MPDEIKYNVLFYRNEQGEEPVRDYLNELVKKKDKDSRIKLNKIRDYVKILRIYGTRAGEPYVKHIEGDIWELRPLRDRIFFVAWINNSFVLLHQFMKKTQKTPKREIKQAQKEYADLQKRGLNID
ncbi:type II toxin-antitoxin system RelE/ParE family toxin [Megamonas hypermegale]|uniref:type II toxin-antitoxin system RelE/ParE family toxin n=1 Tax=Megamonas hypermegale TaxID=158847 RepID=UPI0026EA4D3A|nr:type II toxin-antitoxin system RelE/ParE family toxin [Megamonas hypermegale]